MDASKSQPDAKMNATEIKVGGCYHHRGHGNCVVINKNRGGYWIQVWGGPCGDKLYTFKGIKGEDLCERK